MRDDPLPSVVDEVYIHSKVDLEALQKLRRRQREPQPKFILNSTTYRDPLRVRVGRFFRSLIGG